ncbi:MAG: Trimethylamine corrinoid protein [Candidatus Bathyarchaeota archaeon BA1]|nr:MAG: Trimethylamine corrinoid protein [Candidatus Bathyarchaeota archaeon BA1]
MHGDKELLDALFNAVTLGDARKARNIAQKAVERGIPTDIALERLMEAMRTVDKRYERKEYFVVDVAAAASAMREAFKVLEPRLKVKPAEVMGKIVIGSLKGNTQSLGKDIVAAALRSAGFQVVDLGVDVAPDVFVDAAVKEGAQIIAISVSVDETVPFLRDVTELLKQKKLSGKVKTVMGGRAISESIREGYGMDAYARDAWDCMKKVRELLRR